MAKLNSINITDFRWWLNLSTSSILADNQFQICKNMFYNQKWQLQTRYWIKKFGAKIGSNAPVNSYFFHQRDDNEETIMLVWSWTDIYRYDETNDQYDSVKSNLEEFEKNWTSRVRKDFAVYRNAIYVADGVNSYAIIDWYTPAFITWWDGVSTTLTDWTSITNGWFKITIDWQTRTITWVDLSSATSMDDIASAVQTAIRASTSNNETVVWDTDHFVISSADTTSISDISVMKKASWTFLWDKMCMTNSTWAKITVKEYSWNNLNYKEFGEQPLYRYINMNSDRLYWCWEDINPNTLYYTDAAPADWSELDKNSVVVWWDEMGRINWMTALWKVMLVMKSHKVYGVQVPVDLSDPWNIEAIDSQNGWYSDRAIQNVWNTLVYFSERWVNNLTQRYTSASASTIISDPLDINVSELTSKIIKSSLNSNCALCIERLGNYYFSFDADGDDIPDTTLVYNSDCKAWTQYDYPMVYDYGEYLTKDGEQKYILASGREDQLYEIETWFDDDWASIEHKIKSKDYDFWQPWVYKTFEYIDIIWFKQRNTPIRLNIEVDGVASAWWIIEDDAIIESGVRITLWTRPIWLDQLAWDNDGTPWVDLYEYVVRLPLYISGWQINFQMISDWWQRTLDRVRIGVNGEPIDLFGYNNIL